MVECEKLDFVAAFSSTAAKFLSQSMRNAVASQTSGYDKNLFHCYRLLRRISTISS